MNSQHLLSLALAVCSLTIGCSGLPKNSGWSVGTSESAQLPIKFASYRELYAFIAKHTGQGVPSDADALFKLAADSQTKIVATGDIKMPYVYLIESHYYNGGIYDQIRGAQGNGSYFILRPLTTNYAALDTDRGFELVGMVDGNSCVLTHTNGTLELVTHWHSSASEVGKMIYKWNGKYFEQPTNASVVP